MKFKYLRSLVAYLLLVMSVGCISDRQMQQAVEPHVAVVTCSGLFYADYHRWPKSREELVAWAAQHEYANFPNERYRVITFEEQSDGSLLVHYESDSCSGTDQIGPVKVSH